MKIVSYMSLSLIIVISVSSIGDSNDRSTAECSSHLVERSSDIRKNIPNTHYAHLSLGVCVSVCV